MTSGKIIGMLLLGLLIGGVVGAATTYVIFPPASSSQSTTQTYTIGGAWELSGALSSFGVGEKNAMLLAVDQLNAMAGTKIHFATAIVDTQSTPQGALQAIQTLVQTDKVSVVVGPISSSSLVAVQQYVDSQHVLLVGCCSTTIQLSQRNDYIVRTSSSDSITAELMFQIMTQANYKHLAIIYQNDAFGAPFFGLLNQTATQNGIQVMGVPFDPSLTDWASEASALSSDVRTMGTSSTAVIMIESSLPAQTNILGHASTDATLSSVRWYAPGGSSKGPNLLPPTATTQLDDWLTKVNYTAVTSQSATTPVFAYFNQTYTHKYGNPPVAIYGLAYDSMMLTGLSILAAGTDNATTLLSTIPKVAQTFVGASGPKAMNSHLDVDVASYVLSQLVKTQSSYVFTQIGTWDSVSQNLVYS